MQLYQLITEGDKNLEKIEARHLYIKNLFSNKYLFNIPVFQRPFSWEEENFEQLFSDIKDALLINNETHNDLSNYESYFLGSLIQFQSEDNAMRYSIIDGQQRMISLSILMAVLRDLIDDKNYKEGLQNCIYQEADELRGIQESIRIELRKNDRNFFKEYILEKKGTEKAALLTRLQIGELSEPQQRMVNAIEIFKKELIRASEADDNFLSAFSQYLLQKVVMVVITTISRESAFRLFNVVNARGMPLTNADLLKSVNLSVIDENELQEYTKLWEDIEEDIGIEKLEMLISFIRSIKMKKKVKKNIFDDFEELFKKEEQNTDKMDRLKGKNFVDYLISVKDIYQEKILEGNIKYTKDGANTYYYNLMSIMRDFLPINDWMTVLIKFSEKFDDDLNLYKFLLNLEKKVVVDWITGLNFKERETETYKIIRLIDEENNPEKILNDSMFHEDIRNKEDDFEKSLDYEKFYSKGGYKAAKYVLFRIDMEKSNNIHKKVKFTGNITVEHILPRNPTHRYWSKNFNERAKQEWTNKLGNLVLLNGRKNSKASNKPFKQKVEEYFEKKSEFEITNELARISNWDLNELEKRHDQLLKNSIDIWIK